MHTHLVLLLALTASQPPADPPLPEGAIARLGSPLPAGHTNRIEQIAFLPDSKTLLTAGCDRTVHVWDIASRRTVRSWKPGNRSLNYLAVSPDGKLAATAGYNDAVIRFWEISTGKEVRSIVHPTLAVGCLAFSPNGKTLATGGHEIEAANWPVRLWDTSTGKQTDLLVGHRYGVGSTTFTRDGLRLVSTASNYGIGAVGVTAAPAWVWTLATGKGLALDAGFNHAAVVSPDSRSVALVRQDNGRIELAVIELAGCGKRIGFEFRPDIRQGPAFSPDSRVLASLRAGVNRSAPGVVLCDTATGKEVHRFDAGYVWHFAFSPDGKTLATGGIDGTVLLWDMTRIPTPAVAPANVDAATLWSDLAGDAPKAYQAIVALGQMGDKGVEILRPRLKPAVAVDAKRLAELLTDLESPTFATRQKAIAALAALQEQAGPALEARLKTTASAEARQQIKLLLEKLDAFLTHPERLREVRAVEALERNGTPAAKQLLQELAKGDPAARLTREATDALKYGFPK